MDRPTWYRIKNLGDDSADVFLFNEIGYGGVTAEAFVNDLRDVRAGRINLHLNSPGGNVFDGIAIHSALRAHAAEVTVYVDALAASIASVIAMAGDRIVMARHSTMMIHEAHALGAGDAGEFKRMAERLDVVSDQIAAIYKERAGGTVKGWREAMRAETWYTDRQAVKAGLADEVGKATGIKNSFDLSNFVNVPEDIKAGADQPAEFDRSEALRQAAQVSVLEVLS